MKRVFLLLLLITLVILKKAVAQAPVAYYPFTGNANDAVGSNHGTVNGATLTADRFGNANSAYSFDGVDDNIIFSAPWTTATDNFSIVAWIKRTNGYTVLCNGQNGFSVGGPSNGYAIKCATEVNFDICGIGGPTSSAGSFTSGLWQHVAVVRESGICKIYINGVFQPVTSSNAPNVPAVRAIIGSLNLAIDFFEGSVDEVKIYNTALTSTQVQYEYLISSGNYSSQFGNSVQMDGANDNIDLGTSFTQQVFTLEMWVKPGATQGGFANIIDNNHTGFQNWVVQQDGSNTNYYIFGVHRSSGGTGIYFQLQANVWQHVALVKSATSLEAYLNGILVATTPWTGTINYSSQFLRLGRWGGGGRNWNGIMDEVRIWSTARTQTDILANMNSQLTGNEADLVAYYDMNRDGQGAGLTVDNKATATGSALNGTTVGTASTPIFAPAVLQQKPGSGNAVSFDGVDDVAQIAHSSNIDFGLNANFSIEFWLKIPVGNQPNTDGPDNMIIEKWINGDPSGYPFTIRYYNQTSPDFGKIRFGRYNGSTGASVLSTVTLNDGKFHHISCIKSGGNLLLYIDGVLNTTAADISTGNTNNNHNVLFARRGGAGYYFNGTLDEVKFWNTDLTQTQIRDRMCSKITSSDVLYPNLVAYYNFDESNGNTFFNATAATNDGALINGPTRVTSGAPIGNASAHDYVNATKTVTLAHASGESFTVTSTSGNPDGIHIYRVDEKPNTLTGTTGVGANDKYFGVFQVNGTAPQYTAVYNYNGNPNVNAGNESQLRLNKRNDNAASSWATMVAIPDEAANTITVTGESTEYILGKLGNPLPLNLISFSGSKQNNDAVLQWETANEINVSRFEVQRSDNGQIFTSIGTVTAGGSIYSLSDPNIFNTKSVVFYRLKSVDTDGRFTYSKIVKLNKQASGSITVFPNPVTDVLTIAGLKQGGSIRLFTADGRLLQQQTVSAQTMTLDMSKYTKGIYWLQFQSNGETLNQKISKN